MNIFTLPTSRTIKLNSVHQVSSLFRTNSADYGSLFWTFDPSNHFLSSRLTELIFSKKVLRIIVFSIILSTLLFWLTILVNGTPKWLGIGCFVLMSFVLYIPFDILVILSFNRDALSFILRSSEFWIKVCYGVLNPLLALIHYHKVGRIKDPFESQLPPLLGYLFFIGMLLVFPLFMIIVGGMDAIPKMKYNWKACIIASAAVVFTLAAFYWQLVVPVESDYVIHVKATGSAISFHALLCNSCVMLAIFSWKQAIDVIRNRDRCISIIYRPYLRWKTITEESDLIGSELAETTTVIVESAT